ncbi:HSP40/DnaJ peptide-binding [Cynara cardunculus var. scolymus]|uniref:HSP40/DnaJ peptide-binding n=1 Tax=Cynara cardunculus var. scolymus TaxID=59895 RepID=A0A103XXS9_CYNCS|nr:HSP40/DnaJ peptide-binding [Cynara cardunculus var. scolymus]
MERRHPPPSSSFNPRNSDDVFGDVGGAVTPPPSSPINPRNSGFERDHPSGGAAMSENRRFKDGASRFSNGLGSSMARKAPAAETLLPCSLEDMYTGGKKKIEISRKSSSNHHGVEILTFEIRLGWRKGTEITFVEKGNQETVYTRDDNDLIINQKILLLEALTGKTIELTTLDGRNLVILVTEVIKPGYGLILPKAQRSIKINLRKTLHKYTSNYE